MNRGVSRYAHEMGMRARIEITEVVRVDIRGFKASDEEQAKHRRPLIRSDDGLGHEFLHWMLKTDIHPAFSARSGGGWYVGYFFAKDIPRIKEWLEEHNKRDDCAEG